MMEHNLRTIDEIAVSNKVDAGARLGVSLNLLVHPNPVLPDDRDVAAGKCAVRIVGWAPVVGKTRPARACVARQIEPNPRRALGVLPEVLDAGDRVSNVPTGDDDGDVRENGLEEAQFVAEVRVLREPALAPMSSFPRRES